MASSKEFRDAALGRLLAFGPVEARSMFGGFGLYLDGVMFALIAYDTLYFKADDHNRQEYVDAGAGPFSYQGRHRPIALPYYQVPAGVYDDPGALADWAGRAHAAARRAKAKKPARKRRRGAA